MSIYCPTDPPALTSVLSRIREKKEDYERYNFSRIQGRTIRAFFDLAQEYETLDNFYRVCVFVPKEFLNYDSCLYLTDPESGELRMACDSLNGLNVCDMPPPEGIELRAEPYELQDSYITPIRGNIRLFANKPLPLAQEIIGIFEVFPLSRLSYDDKLFFEKYANRIGYNLHYKMIALQNQRHLQFINNLVADIEHNVIVPNMRYKVFLNNLKKKILKIREAAEALGKIIEMDQTGIEDRCNLSPIRDSMDRIHRELLQQYEEVSKHYRNTSMFLESLLRRDHFEKGELVLRRRLCRFKKEIIDPQLERYMGRLERKGIHIDMEHGGMPDEDIPLAVDMGLISQVFANLFSNAEKYCEEVRDECGHTLKFISYGREIMRDFFGPGRNGIKFNVFSTGPHIPPEEADHLFDEGFRGSRALGYSGSGHGLHFVKKVIEVHGGVVGYEPTHLGNNFYFILPLKEIKGPVETPARLSPARP